MHYLFQIVGSVLQCVPEFSLTDVSAMGDIDHYNFVLSLGQVESTMTGKNSEMMGFISSYDTTLSSSEWATAWADLLKKHDSLEALSQDCRERAGLGKDSSQERRSRPTRREATVPTAFAFRPDNAEEGEEARGKSEDKENLDPKTEATRAKKEEEEVDSGDAAKEGLKGKDGSAGTVTGSKDSKQGQADCQIVILTDSVI